MTILTPLLVDIEVKTTKLYKTVTKKTYLRFIDVKNITFYADFIIHRNQQQNPNT